MAFWKRRSRGSFAPSSNDRFAAVYLGQQSVADDGAGLDQATPALDGLYRAYKEGKETAQRVTVEVIVNGLVVNKIKGFSAPADPSSPSDNRVLLAAAKMYFGATDPTRPRVFFVVKRVEEAAAASSGEAITGAAPRERCECHAFLCDSPTAARTLTLQLVEVFGSIGDAETKLAHRRSTDYAAGGGRGAHPNNNNHQQQQQHSGRLEKGLLRSQSLNLPRSRSRSSEAVSALKITMNVDPHSSSTIPSSSSSSRKDPANEGNNNSEIARILAKRELSEQRAARSAAAAAPLHHPRKGDDGTNGAGVSPMVALPADKSGPGRAALPGAHDSVTEPDLPRDKFPGRSTKPGQQPLASVKEESPRPSPKPSPKERKMMSKADALEGSKENRQVGAGGEVTDRAANKRKSVRFADDAEII